MQPRVEDLGVYGLGYRALRIESLGFRMSLGFGT